MSRSSTISYSPRHVALTDLVIPPKNPSIVAVHGLNGDAVKTCTARNGKTCWLNHPDFLPKYIKNARVLVWGYNANVSSITGPTSSNRILQHAQTLVQELEADREVRVNLEDPLD